MVDYSEKQNQLHISGEKVLKDINLIAFLSKFGRVEIVGSFALELMTWEDIDIIVLCNPKNEYLFKSIEYLFQLPNIYSLPWIQDFRKSIHKDRPQGLYLQAKYLVSPNTFWKIDIWFLPDNQFSSHKKVDEIKARLTDKNRQVILTIKNEMRDELEKGKEISGIDVYTAVLDHNVKNLSEFKEYLNKTGRI